MHTYGDERSLNSCVYCGEQCPDTRDHVPSRVLLDEPYPDQLPVVPACALCNNGFSADERYLACLIDCVIAGSSDLETVSRPKIRRILREDPALAARLAAAKAVTQRGTEFRVEDARVRNVVLKLARGHAAFELHDPETTEPSDIWVAPLCAISESERESFENGSATGLSLWPEVGSRSMQRLLTGDDLDESGWIIVQPNRYRYVADVSDEGTVVRIVLSEYLGCKVCW